ncbi:NADH dehydrogenase [Terrihabitans soli]|uniref:NADH:ubiquinone reductase (non-electrogenic) n=1 Tax=Terrihabitans soli TaxID=708113 RepID=A0A6S6QN73_9HYPH|nr:NAD(P)/FAD-dependent oxidoreductase [Terrihabitans soli]BCJ91954.1 NADH dehydrogenase [Terrihabitans soli]
MDPRTDAERPRIVIIGGGFGGLTVAQKLHKAETKITLIDRRNHHLFQPLLYQVATAALSPAQIAQPIRFIFRDQKNVTVILDEVTGVEGNHVVTRDAGLIPFDFLVVAAGASHAYFGRDDWKDVAPGLKSLEDATNIRRRILDAFERAEIARTDEEREALLTFCIVGGGPTGVEMAGSIVELAFRTLKAEFRNIDTTRSRVILIEAGPRILASMPEKLSSKAQQGLERLGVIVRTGSAVTECRNDRIELGTEHIPCRTIIWAAGVKAAPVGGWLGAKQDRAGRVVVEPDLSIAGQPNVFVIGDNAAVFTADGSPVPGIAAAAKQQGKFVAKKIAARLAGKPESTDPFRYINQGNLATIGRSEAVADLGRIKLWGTIAWFFWGFVHIFFLIDFRNRISVSVDWLWSYLTFGRGARLITHPAPPEAPDIP